MYLFLFFWSSIKDFAFLFYLGNTKVKINIKKRVNFESHDQSSQYSEKLLVQFEFYLFFKSFELDQRKLWFLNNKTFKKIYFQKEKKLDFRIYA